MAEVEEIWIDDPDLYDPKDQATIDKYAVPNKWDWDVFGNGDVVFALPNHVSLWKRFWMRMLYGSKFKKL